jgi:hypothetical protein
VEHVHEVAFDAKKDPGHVWASAVEKLPDFNG